MTADTSHVALALAAVLDAALAAVDPSGASLSRVCQSLRDGLRIAGKWASITSPPTSSAKWSPLSKKLTSRKPLAREALLDARFGVAEHKRNIWFATVPDDVEPEDLLKSSYWSHVALQLRPFDEIIVTNDDCSWRIWLVVEDAWNIGAHVSILARHDMRRLEQPEAETDLRIRWSGPHRRWTIIRRDGGVVKDQLPSKELALQHLTAMANEKVA